MNRIATQKELNTIQRTQRESVRQDDPGAYRWLIFGILMGIYIIGLFQRLCLGVVRQPLSLEFGMDAAMFGYLGGIYFNAYMLMQIPTGMLTDAWGSKKTIVTGTSLMVLGTLLFAGAGGMTMLFLGRLLCGAGAAMLYIPIMKIMSFWYTEREYGPMTGLITFLGYLGGILAQAPLAYVVMHTSWRNIFGGIALTAVLLLLLCGRLVYTRPEDAGMAPLADTDCRFEGRPLDMAALEVEFKQLLSRARSWPPAMISMGVFGAFNALSGVWGASYIVEVYQQSYLEASGIVTFAIIGMCLGCLVITGISERLGRRKPLMIACCSVLCLCWMLLIINSGGYLPLQGLRILMLVLGFCSSVLVLAVVSIKEMHLAIFSGMSISIYNTACFLGAAVAAPVIGLIIKTVGVRGDSVLTYRAVFGFCLALSGLAWIGSLLIKETYCHNMGSQLEVMREIKKLKSK